MRSLIRILAGMAITLAVVACQAQESTSQGQTIEGRLSVIVVDNFDDGTASRDYLLSREDKSKVVLVLPNDIKSSKELESGQRIRTRGAYASDPGGTDLRRFRVTSMEVLTEQTLATRPMSRRTGRHQ
jgi:hypothetical protein